VAGFLDAVDDGKKKRVVGAWWWLIVGRLRETD
jgi:hypothetical protein